MQPLLTPEIAAHVAEVLARRGHRAKLRELALSSSAHFYEVLPVLYREVKMSDQGLNIVDTRALADSIAFGGSRCAWIRSIQGAGVLDDAALEVIEKATSLVELSLYVECSNASDLDRLRGAARRLSRAIADRSCLVKLSLDYVGSGSYDRDVMFYELVFPESIESLVIRIPLDGFEQGGDDVTDLGCLFERIESLPNLKSPLLNCVELGALDLDLFPKLCSMVTSVETAAIFLGTPCRT